MLIISRKDAFVFLSMQCLLKLSQEKRETVLMNMVAEFEEDYLAEKDYNKSIIEWFFMTNEGVTNRFLAFEICKATCANVFVEGEVEELHKCPCCEYKTLRHRGYYEVCRLCGWEDDGINDWDDYSNCNRRTLMDARKLFELGKLTNKEHERYFKFER